MLFFLKNYTKLIIMSLARKRNIYIYIYIYINVDMNNQVGLEILMPNVWLRNSYMQSDLGGH